MITGQVTADREAIVRLTVKGPAGDDMEIETVLDTGFTEFLTLPPAVVVALALPYQYAVSMLLADGSVLRVRVYETTVIWNGQNRVVPVQETDSDALLGMSLLYGSHLALDAIDGGQVSISDLP
jgi:clan AA aspartic protease